jgi:hypothetical protein
MKARARTALTTLGLLAAVAAALFLAWRGVEKPAERDKAGKEAEEKLLAVGRDQVKALRLAAKGQEIRLERAEGGGWRIAAPVAAPADRGAADALLDTALGLRRRQRVAEPDAGLGAFGLDPPRLRLTLELAGGGSRTVEAGAESPFDGSLFVRVDGGPVVSVAPGTRYGLEKGLFDLREKQLFPVEEKEGAHLEVKGPKLAFALSRQGGEWRLAAPVAGRADDAAVDGLLSTLRGLRAARFDDAPGPERRYGLDRPRWSVKLGVAGGAERTLEIGAPKGGGKAEPGGKTEPGGKAEPELWARVSGSRALAAVSASEVKGLEVDLWALRDKSVLRFETDRVAAVRVERGGEVIEARRGAPSQDGGASREWSLTSPRAAPATGSKVSGLLYALQGLRASRLADERGTQLADHGLAPPASVVTLLGSGGEVLARLEVGKASGEETFVRGSAGPGIVAVTTSSLAQIPRAPEDLAPAPGKPGGDGGAAQGG